MRQAVCHWSVIRKVPAQSQVSTRGFSGGMSEKGTVFSPNISVYHFQYHGTRAAYAFTYLPPTLHNLAIEDIKRNTHTQVRYGTSGVKIHPLNTGLNLFVLERLGILTYESLKYSLKICIFPCLDNLNNSFYVQPCGCKIYVLICLRDVSKRGTGEYDLSESRRDGVKMGVGEIQAGKFLSTQRVKIHYEVDSKYTPQRKCKLFLSENVKGRIDLIKTCVEGK
jgi:hypothetical protein